MKIQHDIEALRKENAEFNEAMMVLLQSQLDVFTKVQQYEENEDASEENGDVTKLLLLSVFSTLTYIKALKSDNCQTYSCRLLSGSLMK